MKWVNRSSLPQHGEGRMGTGRVILLLLLSALALAPAACGRKGEPVLPPGQSDNYPHRYPQSTDPQQGVFN
jgi:predicted small lipoprotein YifL